MTTVTATVQPPTVQPSAVQPQHLATPELSPSPSLALRDLKLLPGFTDVSAAVDRVDLTSRLCRSGDTFLSLKAPVLSAPMQAVTDRQLAQALAQLGGLAVLPAVADPEQQARSVAAVKQYKAGFQTDIVTLSPGQDLRELTDIIRDSGYSTFPVTDSGLFHGRLLGIITDKDYDSRLPGTVGESMRSDIQCAVDIDDLATANRLMIQYGRGFLPIVSADNTLKSVVFKKDLDKHLQHPAASIDAGKRLLVGAAISTHPGDRERIDLLAEAQVDVFVIDAADGHSIFQAQTLAYIKQHYSIPVIAGNVVTAAGFRYLAEAGADAVKIGMGIGSGCTTSMVKATGRGQATAISEIAAARQQYWHNSGVYIPLIADGSISTAADIAIALALGADSVMMGNFFARCSEGAGALRQHDGRSYKEYWMEGSLRAKNLRRYHQTSQRFFAEGVDGFVPCEGSVFERLPQTLQMLRASLSTCGCESIEALHQRAQLEQLSATAIAQSQVQGLATNLSL